MLVTEILSLGILVFYSLKRKNSLLCLLITMSTLPYLRALMRQVLSQVLGKSDRVRVVTVTIKCDHRFSEAKSRMEGGVGGMPKGS